MKNALPRFILFAGIYIIIFVSHPRQGLGQKQIHLKPKAKTTQKAFAKDLKWTPKAKAILEKAKARRESHQRNTKGIQQFDQLKSVNAQKFFGTGDSRVNHLIDPSVKVVYGDHGLPIFIDQSLLKILHPFPFTNTGNPESQAYQFLNENKGLLQINQPDVAFALNRIEKDDLGFEHVWLDQVYRNVPVWGSEVIVHLKNNSPEFFTGRYWKEPKHTLPVTPTISGDYALKIAAQEIRGHSEIVPWPAMLKLLMDTPLKASKLMLLPDPSSGEFQLAWKVDYHANLVEHWVYFIDAHTGSVLKRSNVTCSGTPATATARDLNGVTRQINTYFEKGTYWLLDASKDMWNENASDVPQSPVGGLITLDANGGDFEDENIVYANNQNNEWDDRALVSAHFNAGLAFEYFRNTHQRNSLDGSGGTVYSIANFDIDDNAFWNGRFIVYGNGRNAFSGSLARAVDVAGHELTHGVIEKTASLIYEFQSGALNESFADIFGAMMDRDDWQIGEEIVRLNQYPNGAMRDMADPNNGGRSSQDIGRGWQPKHMNEYLNLNIDQDNGGVHINSGIPNHAFYRFAIQVGKETAEKVYYRALTNYLTRSSKFIDCRLAVVRAAQDLFGNNVVSAAEKAFDDVGIFGTGSGNNNGGGTNTGGELPTIAGDQFILTSTENSNGSEIIGNYSFADETYQILSNQATNPKPSVDETGSVGVFVNEFDKQVYILDLSDSDPNANAELAIEDGPWSKVIINRDASKIALLRELDNKIIFFDSDTEAFNEFELFNPNTSIDGVFTKPDYADVIEFDPTGQFIVYDAFNSINSTDGYFDIGIINVWNNSTQSLGSGNIFKLFSDLRLGISIGNPTFAKTNSNILSFEVFDSNEETATVYTYNVETEELVRIWGNTFYSDFSLLGSPSFAPDDKGISFTAENNNGAKVIAVRNLGDDKLTPTTEAGALVQGEFPVWYAKGARQFQSPIAAFRANATTGEAPFTVSFFDDSENSPLQWEWTFEGGNPSTSLEQEPIIQYSQPGIYAVSLKVTNDAGSDTETKTQFIVVNTPACSGLSAADITIEEIGYSHFFLRWLDVAETYTVRFRQKGTTEWSTLEDWEGNSLIASLRTPCTTYEWEILDGCGANNFIGLELTTGGCDEVYCYSYGVAFDNWIQSISINEVDFISGRNYGHGLFTDQPISVNPGQNYALAMTPGTRESQTTGLLWSAYLDINRDGDFGDPGELVVSTTNNNQNTVNTTLSIPNGLVSGNYRLRFIMETENNADPCRTDGNREVEDYTLAIGSTTSIEDYSVLSKLEAYPNPSAGSVNIDLTLLQSEPIQFVLFNILGERVFEQEVTNPVPGAQLHRLDLNHLANGQYRLVVQKKNLDVIGNLPIILVR